MYYIQLITGTIIRVPQLVAPDKVGVIEHSTAEVQLPDTVAFNVKKKVFFNADKVVVIWEE